MLPGEEGGYVGQDWPKNYCDMYTSVPSPPGSCPSLARWCQALACPSNRQGTASLLGHRRGHFGS